MNNQWFYIRQWKQKSWERLLEHRTIRVHWDVSENEQSDTLPKFVRLPAEIDLTNKAISSYLSKMFSWSVSSWSVAHKEQI